MHYYHTLHLIVKFFFNEMSQTVYSSIHVLYMYLYSYSYDIMVRKDWCACLVWMRSSKLPEMNVGLLYKDSIVNGSLSLLFKKLMMKSSRSLSTI